MKKDKEIVSKFFHMKGIETHIISNKTPGKNPDIELYSNNSLLGYCEIKSILDYEFSGERNDPTFNKIQNKIHEAAKQFAAYNSKHFVPNLLLFFNHFRYIDFQDLGVVLTGQYTFPNKPSEPIDIRYAKRLSKNNSLEHIDCFIWMDSKKSGVSCCFNDMSEFKDVLKNRIGLKRYEAFNSSI